MVFGIILILIADVLMALSSVLQHKSTNSLDLPEGTSEGKALLLTLKNPLFLFAFLLMVLGFAFQTGALGVGILAIVQVLYVVQLVFILPLAQWILKTKIAPRDWAGAMLVMVGVGMFIAFADPATGNKTTTNSAMLIAIAVTGAICLISIVLGYMFKGGPRAALIGFAGGVVNGLVASLVTATFGAAANQNILTSWMLYATILAALLGVLFPLMAFRAGPITSSFPAVMALNPITATVLGIYLFHQNLNTSPVHLVLMVAGAVLTMGGILWLSRSKAIAQAFEEASTGDPIVDAAESAALH